VAASAWAISAKASWIDRYDAPNSGYCETTPPGGPIGLYLCSENSKRNVLQQKTKAQFQTKKRTNSKVTLTLRSSRLNPHRFSILRRRNHSRHCQKTSRHGTTNRICRFTRYAVFLSPTSAWRRTQGAAIDFARWRPPLSMSL
jgi:hypothetical protein